MNAEWVRSPAARRILVHWADARPAWLWSGDGSTLLWRNAAARFFNAKLKKYGLKLAPDPVPIKGQVARLIRLGSPGRSSLSRIRFLAGGRPVSTTCTVTPIELADGQKGALIVAVDPVDRELLEQPEVAPSDSLGEALLPAKTEFLLIGPDGKVRTGSPAALDRFAEAGDNAAAALIGEGMTPTRLTASPEGHQLLLIETRGTSGSGIDEVRAEEGVSARDTAADEPESTDEPLLPMGLPPVEVERVAEGETSPDNQWVEPAEPPAAGQSLSSLFDRLADHDVLYTPLTATDEPASVREGLVPETMSEDLTDELPGQATEASAAEPDVIAAVIEFADDLEQAESPAVTYRVIGRGFTPMAPSQELPPPSREVPSEAPPDPEAVERASRYNFDELSRILSDRVSTESAPVETAAPLEPIRQPAAAAEGGALINIAAETFILNRLPLGIMVFRDQQVLFANRALTDLTGYDTIDSLRVAGLSAIFPSDDVAASGPVTHLVRRDGTPLPVTARLQSITWQGRPALMLSASMTESRLGHEGAVKTFAEMLADAREEGFVLADRAGMVTLVSLDGRIALGRAERELAGEPLAALVHSDDRAAIKDFLERPARFAETARPSILLRGEEPGTEILLFAEGQAGIVTGYFGFVRRRALPGKAPAVGGDEDVEPSMLARVSRGVRRPLNTIIGFADLIRSAAFGAIENHRYLEYARDIRTAGQEIAVLVDELEDYARLREGKYAARPADLDLGALLESCVVRVRGQAGAARVLVRSAISERLPRIRADRASLGQAILNLLASAIDQTPPGGSVILSAQHDENGSVAVNVRDSGEAGADLGERFVVFRDGVGKDGEALAPVRSSVGLALTRSLLAVNACSLSVDPAGAVGTLFSLAIPADLVAD